MRSPVQRLEDSGDNLLRLGVDRDDRAALQQVVKIERLLRGRSDDQRRIRVAEAEPTQHAAALFLPEVERLGEAS